MFHLFDVLVLLEVYAYTVYTLCVSIVDICTVVLVANKQHLSHKWFIFIPVEYSTKTSFIFLYVRLCKTVKSDITV